MLNTKRPLLYNPFDPALRADPYPAYRRLRDEDPVHRSPLGFGRPAAAPTWCDAYLRTQISQRRRAPRDDLLSEMLGANARRRGQPRPRAVYRPGPARPAAS